ncbi:ParA family protein [Pseudoxanthomonas sp. PXM05]|uniref:ParA family protein n=1 Tax=Pseudoxanthomonas sp. PXM05 TaxID=2854775 RepID=UPI001C47948A|nr:ParA family protein [Pseudoxanthomonas sp. PXM05]MBV7474078.1 ParA family protein [Pseudoxanthomonas sp. PXM05]
MSQGSKVANGKTVPVVAVLNMKGGVGKTTVAANVMRAIFDTKKRVQLIDFDPQMNLTQLLLQPATYQVLKASNQTMLSVMESAPNTSLFNVTTNSISPPLPSAVSRQLRYFTQSPDIDIRLASGDFGMVKYSLIDGSGGTLAPVRARFSSFIAEAKKDRDVICIDCNPSSTFLTVSALEVATHILVPIKPDRYSVLGLEMLHRFVEQLPNLTTKPKFIVLLNDVPRAQYDNSVESSVRSHPNFASNTLSAILHHSKILAAHPKHTGFAAERKGPYKSQAITNVKSVANELVTELGL